MNNPDRICETCKFSSNYNGWLECRRHSPQLINIVDAWSSKEAWTTQWPKVNNSHYCGDFEMDYEKYHKLILRFSNEKST